MLTVSISILCSPSKGFAVHREWDLLHAVLRFWDPENHVFRFGLDEICSTIEDFSAILDINKNLPLSCQYSVTLIVNPCVVCLVFLFKQFQGCLTFEA